MALFFYKVHLRHTVRTVRIFAIRRKPLNHHLFSSQSNYDDIIIVIRQFIN